MSDAKLREIALDRAIESCGRHMSITSNDILDTAEKYYQWLKEGTR